jgi:hypothetical protein
MDFESWASALDCFRTVRGVEGAERKRCLTRLNLSGVTSSAARRRLIESGDDTSIDMA